MSRLAWVSLVCISVLCASSARALDPSSPHLRVGLSAGLFGSLPIGGDADPEFDSALWMHLEPLSMDIGDYVQLNLFFRLAVAGGYDTGPLRASIAPTRLSMEQAGVEGSVGPNFRSRESLLGVSGRVFPLGATRIRPFLSFGTGLALAGGRFNALAIQPEMPEEEQELEDGMAAARKQALGPAAGATSTTYRHVGLGLTFGLGVRFDPTVGAFGEEWVLPILVELSFVKNVWLGLDRTPGFLWEDSESPDTGVADPPIQPGGAATERLAGKHMNVDFLGVLITFGFLR